MSIENVEQAIRGVKEVADQYGGWISEHQTANRYAIIDPVLWALGWRTWIPWECKVEIKRGKAGRADYVLLNEEEEPFVVIEAKGLFGGSNYNPTNFRRKLASYARGITEGVAVLTNGWTWEIYDLSNHGVTFEGKKAAEVNFSTDSPEKSARVLYKWLRKKQKS